jgi:flagellar hook-associated protein 1 FlgK
MESSMGAINIALTALYAQRRGLDVAGENIANVNTAGYTRQRVDLKSMAESPVGAIDAKDYGANGGVTIANVDRMQDELLISRARTEHGQDSYLGGMRETYGQIEQVFNEPSDTGVQAQLGKFWSTLHDLANNPGDLATRNTVLQQAGTVTDGLNAAHANLAGAWTVGQKVLTSKVTEINTTADTVAQLNKAIRSGQASETPTNTMQDQRDSAILRLSELTGATATSRDDGTMDVYVGGSALVAGSIARQLKTTGALRIDDAGTTPVSLQWTDNQGAASISGGEAAASLQSLNSVLPGQSASLDQVATDLMTAVNTQHAAGFDLSGNAGGKFFTGTGAADITVAITDPKLIAASGNSGGPNLDNTNASKLADIGVSTTGPDSTYRQMIATLGVVSQSTNRRLTIQDGVKQQVDTDLDSASGVNLDEEMANMLSYQRAYEAAARLMTTLDSTLDTLINHMGVG